MSKQQILTFDLEDWFHVLQHPYNDYCSSWETYDSHLESIVLQILSLLSEYNTKATFFTLGWIGEKYPSLLKHIADQGHEIGMHTYYHTYLFDFSQKEFEKDLLRTKEVLFKASGFEPISFRAPGFSVTKENIHLLKIFSKHHILYDSSINPGFHTHGTFKDFPHQQICNIDFGNNNLLTEFPVSTFGLNKYRLIYGGGGYFRAYPFFFTEYLSHHNPYTMFYLHPREFDVNTPRVPTHDFIMNKKLYQNVSKNFLRLEKLVKKYQLKSIIETAKLLDKTQLIKYNVFINEL